MTTPNDAAQPQLQIPALRAETLEIPIVGTAPMIMHRWSDKAKQQMLDAQQGKARTKEIRDPETEYNSSMYRMVFEDGREGYGFPTVGFKAATVSAARFYGKSVSMTALRQLLFFRGMITPADPSDLVEIVGKPNMREDMVRVGQGTDLRYRAEFPEWSATLRVVYVNSSISRESVLALVEAGGLCVGVGEWRPQRSGAYGTYRIDPDREVMIHQSGLDS